MNIVEQHVLRGPNPYSPHPCLLSVLDLPPPADAAAGGFDGFAQRLAALLPGLREHLRAAGGGGGPALAPGDAAGLARVVGDVTMALQRQAGTPAGFVHTEPVPGAAGRYRVVCAYEIEPVAIDAVELALALVDGLLAGDPGRPPPGLRLADGLDALRATAQRRAIGTSTGAILRAARAQGIPAARITAEANMFVLGWGARQKRLRASITGDTGHVAVGIAADKELTKTLLQEAGVPVPEGVTARSLDQALRAARQLGGLVTVKPLDGNHGRGVTTRCGNDDEVALAFERAREHGRTIIVERYISGDDYRVLVAGGRVVAAALRRPAAVTGDGVSTVRELVALENRNPARGEGHSNILTRIPLDGHADTALAEQDLQADSIPARGRRVVLRGNANLSSGGTAEDVTDRLPPHTLAVCARAVRKIGLDVAGIDLVCQDIGVPLDGSNGAVIEINAAPGLRMHEYPSAGTPRDAGAAIVKSMFGDGDGRIPVVAVAGATGGSATTLIIDHALRRAGIATGCASGEGVFIDGAAVGAGDGDRGARAVLAAPEVAFAVLETPHRAIVLHGLAFDRCDVAVLLDRGGEPGGVDGLATPAELARADAVVARTATRAVVLDAGGARRAELGASVDAQVEVVYFGGDASHPALRGHLERGGRAAFAEDGALVLADGKSRRPLLRWAETARAPDDDARRAIAHVLAAAAALMASGLQPDAIAEGLCPFMSAARLLDVGRVENLDQVAEPVRLGDQVEGVELGTLVLQA
ncbi:cyanophycin synthetase family protein [Burkholderia sp. LMU1-1-1.1]|uniref:cyanophycin synthetase family protein n=1 Tax=Burkholderia sp. LMU1-1-1.1 TaxID=3135266 RepID=UPI00342E0622